MSAALPDEKGRKTLDANPDFYRKVARETMLGVNPLQKAAAERQRLAGRFHNGCC